MLTVYITLQYTQVENFSCNKRYSNIYWPQNVVNSPIVYWY